MNRNMVSRTHLPKVQKVLLFRSLEEMGNLFIEEGLQLVSIHMKDAMDVAVGNSVQNVKEEEQFKAFVKE